MDDTTPDHSEKMPHSTVGEDASKESGSIERPAGEAIREKTLVLKIDLHILPVLVLVYIMAFIDRYGPEISLAY